jgi:hypothetical protein
MMFGFIFLVKPFSFILDSFHNKIRQVFFIYQIFQKKKWRPQCENTQGDNKNGECIVVE